MGKLAVIITVIFCLVAPRGMAQVSLSGQTAVSLFKSARTQSQSALDDGRPSFGWQTYAFLDAAVSDHVGVLSTLRVNDNEVINFDYVAIRLTNLTSLGLNVQAGKFDLPFGNLGERRYPRRNALFGLPVIYQYYTALPDHIISEAGLVAGQGKGYGMRVLDLGLYDIGAMVYGSAGPVDYALAVSNGTVSTASYGNENTNGRFGQLARIAVTPFTGLTIGGAYDWGSYIDKTYGPLPAGVDADTYMQQAAEVDLEFSRGHAVFYGEGVMNTWQVPLGLRKADLKVLGFYLEGKYTLFPRLYAALRLSGLKFNDVVLEQVEQPWDYDVTEWEGGFGYFIERDVLLKLVRRETRIHGGTFPKDNLSVLELVVAY